MKMVFRLTPPKIVGPPKNAPTIKHFNINPSPNALETRWSFAGSMFERVKSDGQPCGSCGGR